MKHLILGTAGHIDHGKTSLVKALTGVDTDRLIDQLRAIDNKRLIDGPLARLDDEMMKRVYQTVAVVLGAG